jgi:hypothetical protein
MSCLNERQTKSLMLTITLDELAEFPARLERVYRTFSPMHRNWKPDSWDGIASEHFAAVSQICHVRDIEIDGYHVRLHRMLGEQAAAPRRVAVAAGARSDNLGEQENGGVLADPAVPARALRANQGHPHGNCIGASIRWTRSRA